MTTPATSPGVRRAAARLLRPVATGELTGMSIRAGDGPEIEITPEMARRAQRYVDEEGAFVRADDVAGVADRLIDRFAGLAHLRQWRLDYWFETKKPKDRGGCATIGKASVDSELLSARTGMDACIVVNRPWWEQADDNARQALVFHELRHLDTHVDDDGNGKLRTVKPGVLAHIRTPRHQAWRLGLATVETRPLIPSVDGLPIVRLAPLVDARGAVGWVP